MKGWNWSNAFSGNSYSLSASANKISASEPTTPEVVVKNAQDSGSHRTSSKFYVDLDDNSGLGNSASHADSCIVKPSYPQQSQSFTGSSAANISQCTQTELDLSKRPRTGPPVLKKPIKMGTDEFTGGTTVVDDQVGVKLRPHIAIIDLTTRGTLLASADETLECSPDSIKTQSPEVIISATMLSSCPLHNVQLVPQPSSITPFKSKLRPMNVEKSVLSPLVHQDKGSESSEQLPQIPPKPIPVSKPRKMSIDNELSPQSEAAVAAQAVSIPRTRKDVLTVINNVNRRSKRRSFTTDDADLGFCGSNTRVTVTKTTYRPPVATKPLPNVLKRLEGTEIGRTTLNARLSNSLETVAEKSRPALPPKPVIRVSPAPAAAGKYTKPPIHQRQTTAGKHVVDSSAESEDSFVDGSTKVFQSTESFDSICSDNMSPAGCETEQPWTSDDSFDDERKFDKATPSHQATRLSSPNLSGDELDGPKIEKSKRIAIELLDTEKTYVDKLDLIDQVFHNEILRRNHEERFIPNEVIPNMFLNIKSIYQFHHDFLLPQLQQAMDNWDSGQRIGIVLKRFAPFLKMYKDYILNFDNANQLISTWNAKSLKFSALLHEIQSQPRCGMLSLQNHMLSPIQRVPRYELLLKEYLKNLDPESEDRQHAEDALVLVTRSAQHANEAIKKIEEFRKLLDVNESLGFVLDLASPTRELIKEGRIMKISARDDQRRDERYFFLFSDFLLVCQILLNLPGMRQQYRLKTKLDIAGMKVMDGKNQEMTHTFHIKSKQRTIEVLFSSQEEKIEWQDALWRTISSFVRQQQTRHMPDAISQFKDNELGTRAPTWTKDQETMMCMICSASFTIVRRRHHCRACGKVVCGNCSTLKVPLAYDENRLNRVCDACYLVLGNRQLLEVEAADTLLKSRTRARSIFKVKATDSCVLSGYLMTSTDMKNWSRRWLALHGDFVLYWFKAHKDVVAFKSTPIPGFCVTSASETTGDGPISRELVIKVSHPGQKLVLYLQAQNAEQMSRWMTALQCVAQLQLPPKAGDGECENLTAPATGPQDSTASVGHAQPAPPLSVFETVDDRHRLVDDNPYADVEFSKIIESQLSFGENPYDEVDLN